MATSCIRSLAQMGGCLLNRAPEPIVLVPRFDSFGRLVLHDNDGIPISPEDKSLPKDDQDHYIYPVLGIDGILFGCEQSANISG